MATLAPRFLVLSLGNKEPYYQTLHSAGHFALASLQRHLGPSHQSPFKRDKQDRALRSDGSAYVLKQSPTSMNVSGPWVNKACKQHLAEEKEQQQPGSASTLGLGLVVVADDLEESFGTVKIRKWTASHRGHNGLKSINASVKPGAYPVGTRMHRISIGIGRPMDRDQRTVSDYVLSPMSAGQLAIIDRDVGPRLLECLETLRVAWEADLAAKAA